ncbi:hypothetical protein OSK38_29110, partial [Escherichia coli]|nr:hypothetical protein [Escherichia coli]
LEYRDLLRAAEVKKKPGKVYEADSFIEKIKEEAKKLADGEIAVDDLTLKSVLQKHTSLPIRLHSGKENIFSAFNVESEIDK